MPSFKNGIQTSPSANGPTAIRLVNGEWDDCQLSNRALLFGELVRRTEGVVKAYHSDLYHDAEWITENISGPTVFFWGIHESGTHLSMEPEATHPYCRSDFWRVEVRQDDRGWWIAEFTEL